ncbi:MAG TPA: hypothetical protein PK011_06790, partial [Marinagarivorans sp.]|nr:hypothetical protein [Marinagarivorans sp.]
MGHFISLKNLLAHKMVVGAAISVFYCPIMALPLMVLEAPIKDPELARCIDEHMSRQQIKDAAVLLELQCANRGIVSTEGLEQLTQLQTLNLFNNRIQ